MLTKQGIMIVLCLFTGGCATKTVPTPAYQFEPPTRQLDYLTDVKPVLVKRCVVCHSCYNSPCQLKLSSWDGLERGASKEAIYNASRLKTMDPSRLFVDAHSEQEWRKKGFHSVTKSEEGEQFDESIFSDFLDILDNFDGSVPFIQRLEKYGVNRAEENFWEVYDWFQERFNASDKQRAGLADLNRYYYRAIEQ